MDYIHAVRQIVLTVEKKAYSKMRLVKALGPSPSIPWSNTLIS